MAVNNNLIVVGIGASAGGLDALHQFFSSLPPQRNMCFVVVMHLQRDHRSRLDVLLSKVARMPVTRIDRDLYPQPCNIYVLPENKNVRLMDGKLVLSGRNDHIINHAVDTFFSSMASAGKNAVGIVLSGTGSDGTEGIKNIERGGGFVMVQDPSSAQFNGMPMSAIKFDHPDVIETPAMLAEFIAKYAFSFSTELRA